MPPAIHPAPALRPRPRFRTAPGPRFRPSPRPAPQAPAAEAPAPHRIRIEFLSADLLPSAAEAGGRNAELRVDEEVVAHVPVRFGDPEARRIVLDRAHTIERRPGEFFTISGTLGEPRGAPFAEDLWVVVHTYGQGSGWGSGPHRAELGPGIVVHYAVSMA